RLGSDRPTWLGSCRPPHESARAGPSGTGLAPGPHRVWSEWGRAPPAGEPGSSGGRVGGVDTTRDQILTEAAALFAERGYHGLSMRELAEAAGISKANLYHHFRNKEELFLAVLLANVERLAAAAAAAECAAGDTRSRLRLLLRGLLGQG